MGEISTPKTSNPPLLWSGLESFNVMELNTTRERLMGPQDGKCIISLITCGAGEDCPVLAVMYLFATRSPAESNASK